MSKSKRKLKQSGQPGGQSASAGSQVAPFDPNAARTHQRAAWKHFMRYFMILPIITLNFAMFMSFITRLPRHHTMDPLKEMFFFGFALVVDVLIFIPLVFETNKIQTDGESIRMSTLLWKTKVPWNKVVKFEQPRFLKFAFLWTERCFYLINRRDTSAYDDLVATIRAHIASRPPKIGN